MEPNEAQLFLLTLSALQQTAESESASKGLIESAEPMTAEVTVERS